MTLVTAFATWILWNRYGEKGWRSAATAEKFRRYWSGKKRTFHDSKSPEFYRAYVSEIRKLFPSEHPQHVLEIGCGDGSAFPYFDLSATSYRGVDFSSHFLDTFRSRYPRIDLKLAEGSCFVDRDRHYDVIFSNEVVQHFDRDMLDRHLQNARAMMHPHSVLILGSLPDRAYRRTFNAGAYAVSRVPRVRERVRLLKLAIRRTFGVDHSGFCYSPREIIDMAKRHGFHARVFPSRLQPHRFHALLSLGNSACDSVGGNGSPAEAGPPPPAAGGSQPAHP
jgi:SAM-dependent methyltransferase